MNRVRRQQAQLFAREALLRVCEQVLVGQVGTEEGGVVGVECDQQPRFNLRLLFRTLRWGLDQARWPSSYSVDVRPDPLNKDTWSKEGLRFIVEDVWEFV